MSVTPTFASLLSDFGTHVAAKFRTGAGEPEDHLRGPLERLISGLGASSGHRRVVLAGEERLGDIHARPDYAVEVEGALVGFIELKAPGKGADPNRFRDRHDRDQWDRLKSLPNLLYTDGNTWALYRYGERVDDVRMLVGDVETAGPALEAPDSGLYLLLTDFLSWSPEPPRTPR